MVVYAYQGLNSGMSIQNCSFNHSVMLIYMNYVAWIVDNLATENFCMEDVFFM